MFVCVGLSACSCLCKCVCVLCVIRCMSVFVSFVFVCVY